jgi:hypothetical protein
MPHYTDSSIPQFASYLVARHVVPKWIPGSVICRTVGSSQRFFNRYIHRVELMVARHLLGELSMALVFEDNEMPHEVEEPSFFEDTFQDNL